MGVGGGDDNEWRRQRTDYRKAENPPNNAPDATPTQKPIMNPVFTRSQHEGPWPYEPLGTAGISASRQSTQTTEILDMHIQKCTSSPFIKN